ncbi:alpha-galactosidase [Xylariales sp. PMI_506]|nr:alpha-galactosidase [Xylariales sp. PMI_506]
MGAPLILSLSLSLFVSTTAAVNNGLARTPQMGWNNWNSLGCDVSEDLLLDTATKLVSLGLRDVGYNYVVLDDCWSERRDQDGILVEDLKKFPRGMKFISDEIHSQNMLFGMYSSAGEMTCARFPGSLDFEEQDAQRFASWGVDYLKYDNCYHMGRFGTPLISFQRFDAMWKALNRTNRPILFSLCNWGEDYVHTWGMSIANSWRMSGDIYDSFTRPDILCSCDDPRNPHCVAPGTHCSVLNIVNKVAPYSDRAQPGGWNDLDMLEVGQGGMTDDEYKAHFTMWSILKSPLLIGADIRHIDAKALSILNNPAIIAVNQDPLGISAHRTSVNKAVKKDKYGVGETQVWSGVLAYGDQVVVFLNAADEDLEMSAELAEVFLHHGPEGSAPQVKQSWDIYDLWSNRMDDKSAESILLASAAQDVDKSAQVFSKLNWWNSSATDYKTGLEDRDERLMGKKIGSIAPQGALKAKVKKHSVGAFRLRSTSGEAKRYIMHKEL